MHGNVYAVHVYEEMMREGKGQRPGVRFPPPPLDGYAVNALIPSVYGVCISVICTLSTLWARCVSPCKTVATCSTTWCKRSSRVRP